MKKLISTIAILGCLTATSASYATEQTVQPKELATLSFQEKNLINVVVRPGLTAYSNQDSTLALKESYSMDLENQEILSAIADLHPGETGFHLSAGMLHNEVKIRQMSDLTVNSDSMSPYFGLGWAIDSGSEKSWVLNLDMGFMYDQLACNGLSQDQCQSVRENIDTSEQNLMNTLESYGIHPVISAGVSFKF